MTADRRLLRDSPQDLVFLADRSEQEWALLVGHMQRDTFQRGDDVIRAGDPGRELILLIEGTLTGYAPAVDGVEREFKAIQAPSVVGEMAFLDGRPRSLTLRAVTDGELLRLDYDKFEELNRVAPELALAILWDLGRIVTLRLRAATEFIAAVID